MIILRDTREQKGWDFELFSSEAEVLDRKLKTGDYTSIGIEDTLVIERKSSVGEFARNIVSASFNRELERLAHFDHAFIIFEFSYRDIEIFPVNSGIPPKMWNKVKISSNFIFSCINRYRLDYGIHCIACNSHKFAERTAFVLMKKYYEDTV